MSQSSNNSNFKHALDYINYTNSSVFLTGKAGTGKTTFLKYIKEHCSKQMAVVAPTGIAAINAGGVTIHSFFQLPFSPFIPEYSLNNETSGLDNNPYLKISSEKRAIFQQLELLIIDEISMVRADVLDAIDNLLKTVRSNYNDAFGGVQVLFIGDMFQLPPVAKEDEWNILSQYYDSPYFFSSNVIQKNKPVYIELQKVYRQKDETFISILNQVRNNSLQQESYTILNKYYNPNFTWDNKKNYITLTTHNHKADIINSEMLHKINSPLNTYTASIEPLFDVKNYPAELHLELKVGAQIMFIKNDLEKTKRYYNGKIGIIEKLEEDKIFVLCSNETEVIEVKKYKWDNIKYKLNKKNNQIEEDIIGSFTQFPLRLAWAITIHKSQGLTFENAIIDAEQSFAPGQVYVALSRCTSLNGMVLLSKISASSLISDYRIIRFLSEEEKNKTENSLYEEKKKYQSNIILQLFCFESILQKVNIFSNFITEQASSLIINSNNNINSLQNRIINTQTVFNKFETELQLLFNSTYLPEENSVLQNRLQKATTWFINEIEIIINFIQTLSITSDNKFIALKYNDYANKILTELHFKQYLLKGIEANFSIDIINKLKKNYQPNNSNINIYSGKNTDYYKGKHPLLFKELILLRNKLAEEYRMPIFMVASTKSIDELVEYLPQTEDDLRQISGFGDKKTSTFGSHFLEVITHYANNNNLISDIKHKPVKKNSAIKTTTKLNTKDLSFTLFKQGNSITEIAEKRNLTQSTIESHLLHYITTNEINIEEIIDKHRLDYIAKSIQKISLDQSISEIKKLVNNDITFSEIKLFIANKNKTTKTKTEAYK